MSGLISPDVIKEEMGRVRRACTELDQLARVVAKSYEEAHDAAFRKQGGTGYETPIGRGNFSGADPTGDVATSGVHRRMRWRLRQASRAIRRLRPILEDAEDKLLEAFMETDPEFREKLRRLRELEAAAEG